MRNTAADREVYLDLIRLCGFFETVGYVTRERYIRIADMYNLLGGSIREYGAAFREHIRHLQQDQERSRQFEHFVWLVDEMRRRRADE